MLPPPESADDARFVRARLCEGWRGGDNPRMGWGGARPGAGRKRGAKSRPARVLSARVREKLKRLARSEDARQFAVDWLREAEPEVLRRALDHPDPRYAIEVWKEMRLRAYGSPGLKVSVEVGPSPAEVIRQIIERRGAMLPEARRQLPAAIDIEPTSPPEAERERPS